MKTVCANLETYTNYEGKIVKIVNTETGEIKKFHHVNKNDLISVLDPRRDRYIRVQKDTARILKERGFIL